MSNPILQTSFKASVAIPGERIVQLSADDTVIPAITAAHKSVGVTGFSETEIGQQATVIVAGIASIETHGAVAMGDLVTAAASGRATVAAAGNRVIGVALSSATAAGQKIRVSIAPSIQ